MVRDRKRIIKLIGKNGGITKWMQRIWNKTDTVRNKNAITAVVYTWNRGGQENRHMVVCVKKISWRNDGVRVAIVNKNAIIYG